MPSTTSADQFRGRGRRMGRESGGEREGEIHERDNRDGSQCTAFTYSSGSSSENERRRFALVKVGHRETKKKSCGGERLRIKVAEDIPQQQQQQQQQQQRGSGFAGLGKAYMKRRAGETLEHNQLPHDTADKHRQHITYTESTTSKLKSMTHKAQLYTAQHLFTWYYSSTRLR